MKTIFLALLLPCCASAATIEKADQLFAKRSYQEALAAYSPLVKKGGEEGLRALYRSVECEGLLFRYGEAAQLLYGVKMPADLFWQGRLLLLRAETGRRFLAQYGYSLPADEEKGTSDVTRLTARQWRRTITGDYDSLWYLRRELLKQRLEGQDYFVDLKGAELSYTPTFWDFVVLRWAGYLLEESEEGGALPDAAAFVEPSYRGDYRKTAPAAGKAAALFENAAGLSSSAMDFAREYWKLERLNIPFAYPGRVAAYDPAALRARALKTLRAWGDSFKTPQGRAWALYRAAILESGNSDFEEVVSLCKRAESLSPGSKPAASCASMRAEIELPRLGLSAVSRPPPGDGAVSVNARNIPQVYFRAYRTNPAELRELSGRDGDALQKLRYLPPDAVRKLLSRKPALEWRQAVTYPGKYRYSDQRVDTPPFEKGLYAVVASGDGDFDDGSSIIKAAILNITDVFLLGTTGLGGDPENFLFDPAAPGRSVQAEAMRFYAVNALDGKPLPGARIDAAFSRSGAAGWQKRELSAGEDGSAAFSDTFRIDAARYEYLSVDPLLSYGGAYAYWGSQAGAYLNVPPPVSIFAETDRPVYRPGQEVKFKATALLRLPGGYKTYDGKSKINVVARDANWQELYSADLPLTGLGSAAASFKVPEGRLLGGYTLTATVADFGRSYSGSANFRVEEYKRPEFEVTLAAPGRPYRYGQKAAVTGEARYYFGSPVPGAVVKYRVKRSRYIPSYCWYWRWSYGGGAESEVASGQTVTGDDGKFSFSFTPGPESDSYGDYPSSYRVEAEAMDAGGRTISASRDYRAGSKAYLFDVSPQAGFFTPEKPAAVDVRVLDLNDSQQAADAEYQLYRLDGEPAQPDAGRWSYLGAGPSLEQAFSAVPDGQQVSRGRVNVPSKGTSAIGLGRMQPGAYRLKLSVKDPWGGRSESSVVLVCASQEAGGNGKLRLPPVTLFERDSYQPGETARALIGGSGVRGAKFAEVLAGNFVLSRATVKEGGLSVFSVKVGAAHRGGFGIRWLGAGNFLVYSGMADAQVPFRNKSVSLSLDYDKAMLPGQKVSWTLRARDAAGRAVSGEARVKVFDRSLEYYAGDGGAWPDQLYPRRYSSGEALGSLFTPQVTDLPVSKGIVRRMLEAFRAASRERKLATLRITSSQVYGGRGGIAYAKSLAFDGGAAGAVRGAPMEAEDLAPAAQSNSMEMKRKAAPAQAPGAADSLREPGGGEEVKARSDFSETAFYEPQLKVTKGKGNFSFSIPERLTSWKIGSYLITGDVKRGAFSAEAVTRKDLMVRLDIPRFFREGDRSRLTALVTNDTEGELSGEVSLLLTRGGDEAGGDFGLGSRTRTFRVKAGGTEPLYWDIAAPRGTGVYKVRAVARAGRLADAQENDLPVLPSRERLIASQVAALDGNSSKTFSLPELTEPDPTRRTESVHLEVQPQLILTVLNSLPFLVHYPYECTEQLLNRYVPLAITNSFYGKYPALREAAAKLPRRTTLTPEWDRDDPARLMTLMETPWETESRGRRSYWPVVDMLDPAKVSAEKGEAFEKLKSYQLSDGSFPWFPGGRSSLYMTLYLLEGLAEAARYGVDIPADMAKRALSWTLSEIPGHMKPAPEETSTALYAAYVVTSFPADWPEAATARNYAKAWVDYADRHSAAMTPLGKAYAAYVYLRLGQKQKAGAYLDGAMQGARSDDISGVYWAPEKISWLWYNDTVEKHAFILRTLLAVRPKDARIPGMVRWLLFNRKNNEWKSTKASAAAIYSLLDVMKARGALDKGDSFSVTMGSSTEKLDLKPFDWVSTPLRWSDYGDGITAADLAPTVRKKGPGLAFASFTGIYTTDRQAKESPDGMMNVSRRYFLRVKEGADYALKPLSDGDAVNVGDEVEVHLTVRTRSQFEYVHIMDPKAAGFEAEQLTSGWKWEQLARYEEPRDSLTNFFVEWLPHGEYVLKYRLRPTAPGTFKAGAAVIQSMYAPEFAAHSAGFTLNVK
ncbi:MAG: MG2 domain-containing protein [Elusimicrobia bacterium]|nr:MG2 domain-containing protein [Elusimicrobiota bacterium]